MAQSTTYDETADGDLSDAGISPTVLPFADGNIMLSGTVGPNDLDYFTVAVPAGYQFSEMTLDGYSGSARSFLGMVKGDQVNLNPSFASQEDLDGYIVFGGSNVGADILSDMGAGSGAIGFELPLPAGDYSFWMQEAGGPPIDFQFTIVIEPVSTQSYNIYLPLAVRN